MPSPGTLRGPAALRIHYFPVAGAEGFCLAGGWSPAVRKAHRVSCLMAVARGQPVLGEQRLLGGIQGSVPATCRHLHSSQGAGRCAEERGKTAGRGESLHLDVPALLWLALGQGASFPPVTPWKWGRLWVVLGAQVLLSVSQ